MQKNLDLSKVQYVLCKRLNVSSLSFCTNAYCYLCVVINGVTGILYGEDSSGLCMIPMNRPSNEEVPNEDAIIAIYNASKTCDIYAGLISSWKVFGMNESLESLCIEYDLLNLEHDVHDV